MGEWQFQWAETQLDLVHDSWILVGAKLNTLFVEISFQERFNDMIFKGNCGKVTFEKLMYNCTCFPSLDRYLEWVYFICWMEPIMKKSSIVTLVVC